MPIRRVTEAAVPLRRQGWGVIRVSKVGKRSREQLVSPREQRQKIAAEAARENIDILDYFEEIDISGRLPLEKRTGLKQAVERIERGEGHVVVAAYYNRMMRSTAVKREVVERVEAMPGGGVLAVDFGYISHKNASRWMTSEIVAVLHEHYARETGEKTHAARMDALDRGLVVFPNVPLGYLKIDRHLVPDENAKPHVVQAFKLRSKGITLKTIQAYLLSAGFKQTYRQVQLMFSQEMYLGYMKDGETISDDTHEAIIDKALWDSVQTVSVPRGRPTSTPRLLSKLGIAACRTCGGALSTGFKGSSGKRWPMYRCAAHNDCPSPITISAPVLEAAVVERAREELSKVRPGMASGLADVRAAEIRFEAAQRDLDETVADLKGIQATNRRALLLGLQETLNEAAANLQRVRAAADSYELLRGDADWDDPALGFEGQRALLCAIFARVTVAPATVDGQRLATRDRVSFELR